MIMLTATYLLQNIQVNCLMSDVRVLFNFDVSTVYAKRASNNRPLYDGPEEDICQSSSSGKCAACQYCTHRRDPV